MYKKGDKVRLIQLPAAINAICIGDICRIAGVSKSLVDGYDLLMLERISDGISQTVYAYRVEPYVETRAFKVGDKVRSTVEGVILHIYDDGLYIRDGLGSTFVRKTTLELVRSAPWVPKVGEKVNWYVTDSTIYTIVSIDDNSVWIRKDGLPGFIVSLDHLKEITP